MTISWFLEEKRLNFGFYLYDHMVSHMEIGLAVDCYSRLCDLSFGSLHRIMVYPLAIIIAAMLILRISFTAKYGRKPLFKCIVFALIMLIVLIIAFIAFPVALQAYYDDIASI